MGGGGEAGGGDGVSGRGGEMVVVTASVAEAMAEAATAWAEQMLWAREVAATVVAAMVEAVTAWAAAGCIDGASMLAEATEEAERAREVVATAAAQGGRRRRGRQREAAAAEPFLTATDLPCEDIWRNDGVDGADGSSE